MLPWWLSDRNVREYEKAVSRYYEILRQREEMQMTNNDHIERTKRMIEVMQAYVDGKKIEYLELGGTWKETTTPSWGALDYRIAKIPDTINWDHVAPEFKYMARNYIGNTALFVERPEISVVTDKAWTYHGNSVPAVAHASYRKGTCDWKESLVIRPGCE